MQPLLRRSVHFVPAVLAALLTTTAPSLAQTCGPAACGAGFHYVHFETLAPGTGSSPKTR